MIVSCASQKGGTGKTTSSIALSAGLARRGKRVLLIDIDSQANSSKVVLPHYQQLAKDDTIYSTILERNPLPIHPTGIPNLDIVPSHILLSNTDVELTTAIDHREARLKNQLDAVKERYDHVFIDCPPALSWLTVNAFTASDGIIVIYAWPLCQDHEIAKINKQWVTRCYRGAAWGAVTRPSAGRVKTGMTRVHPPGACRS